MKSILAMMVTLMVASLAMAQATAPKPAATAPAAQTAAAPCHRRPTSATGEVQSRIRRLQPRRIKDRSCAS